MTRTVGGVGPLESPFWSRRQLRLVGEHAVGFGLGW
jgi:hypothetical protein